MIVSRLCIAMAWLSLGATAAHAQSLDPLLMTPTTGWVVDYADGSCALRREFKASDKDAILELRQFEPGDSFEVRLISQSLPRTDRPPLVRFDPDDAYFEPASAFRLAGEETGGVMYKDSLRPTALKRSPDPTRVWPPIDREARERAITALTVSGTFEQTVTLKTGAMHEPMQALRTCLDDLLTQWGLDAASQHNLSKAANPIDPAGLARRIMSLPRPSGMRAGQNAIAELRVIVGADGKPTSCFANTASDIARFDKSACDIYMRYSRFEPALDARGRPVASTYRTTVVLN